MTRRWLQAAALALFIATTVTLTSAQRQATMPTFPTLPSCPPAPLSLSPCIGYVFGLGSATLDSCCSQLRTFVRAQAPCICAASKLAPSPVGLLLGQAQAMIPNVCNLPNPCDDESTAPAATATPAGTGTSPPAATTPDAPAGGQVPSAATATTATPSATPSSTTPPTETPSTSDADLDDDEDDDSPAAGTAPGQVPPAGTGSKLPELLHAAGATRSRHTAVGTLMVTLFLASVAAVYV